MKNEKVYTYLSVLFMFIITLCGCASNRHGAAENILDYQRKIAELENTVRLYEQRIEIADQQIRADLDTLRDIGERAETIEGTVDDLIRIFDEYQRGVEQLIRDYQDLRKKIEETNKVSNNTFVNSYP